MTKHKPQGAFQNSENPFPYFPIPVFISAEYTLRYEQKWRSAEQDRPEVICPICNSCFSEFFPILGGTRKARCPVCGSLERHRHVWVTITEDYNFFNCNNFILHFAPEPFFKKIFSARFGSNYIDCDLYAARASNAIDITSIPFENNSFDRIICNHVLEHVPDDRKAMQELCRTLKKNGIAYITVPARDMATSYEDSSINTPELRRKHFGQGDHVRIYSVIDFVERLNDAGFSVQIQFPKKQFGLDATRKLVLGDTIYICKKT